MYKNYLKRVFDFTIVLVALLIIWPILLLITLWFHNANKEAGAILSNDSGIFVVI